MRSETVESLVDGLWRWSYVCVCMCTCNTYLKSL